METYVGYLVVVMDQTTQQCLAPIPLQLWVVDRLLMLEMEMVMLKLEEMTIAPLLARAWVLDKPLQVMRLLWELVLDKAPPQVVMEEPLKELALEQVQDRLTVEVFQPLEMEQELPSQQVMDKLLDLGPELEPLLESVGVEMQELKVQETVELKLVETKLLDLVLEPEQDKPQMVQ